MILCFTGCYVLSKYLKESNMLALKLLGKERVVWGKSTEETQPEYKVYFERWEAKYMHEKWAKSLKTVEGESFRSRVNNLWLTQATT